MYIIAKEYLWIQAYGYHYETDENDKKNRPKCVAKNTLIRTELAGGAHAIHLLLVLFKLASQLGQF